MALEHEGKYERRLEYPGNVNMNVDGKFIFCFVHCTLSIHSFVSLQALSTSRVYILLPFPLDQNTSRTYIPEEAWHAQPRFRPQLLSLSS